MAAYYELDFRSSDDSKKRAGLIIHDVSRSELKRGDHIYIYRCGGVYSHHGIFTGEYGDDAVIHFSASGKSCSFGSKALKSNYLVQSCSLTDFTDESSFNICLVKYDVNILEKILKRQGTTHCFESSEPDCVIERAQHYRDNPIEWDDYNVLFNNCESFAFYCKTGLKFNFASQVATASPINSVAADLTEGAIDGVGKGVRFVRTYINRVWSAVTRSQSRVVPHNMWEWNCKQST